MTNEQFNKRDFKESLNEMINEEVMTTYDSLKEFAIEKIKEDDLITALHIIESMIKGREVYRKQSKGRKDRIIKRIEGKNKYNRRKRI